MQVAFAAFGSEALLRQALAKFRCAVNSWPVTDVTSREPQLYSSVHRCDEAALKYLEILGEQAGPWLAKAKQLRRWRRGGVW